MSVNLCIFIVGDPSMMSAVNKLRNGGINIPFSVGKEPVGSLTTEMV